MVFKYFFLRQKGYIKGPFLLTNLQNMFRAGSVFHCDEISPDKYHWYPIDSFLAKPKEKVDIPLEIDMTLLEPMFTTLRAEMDDAPISPSKSTESDEYIPLTIGEQIAQTLNLPFSPMKSVKILANGIFHGEVHGRTILTTAAVVALIVFLLATGAVWFFQREKILFPASFAFLQALLFSALLLGISVLLHRDSQQERKDCMAVLQFAQMLLTQTFLVFAVGMPLLAVQISTGGFPMASVNHILVAAGISGVAFLAGVTSTVVGIIACRKCSGRTVTAKSAFVSAGVLLLSILYGTAVALQILKIPS